LVAVIAGFALAAPASAAPTATFANTQPVAIPGTGNSTPYGTSILVNGLMGTTTSVAVTVNGFSHTFPDDVGIALVGPTGVAMVLEDGAGGSGDLADVTTSFRDAASQLPDSSSWTSGSYKPTNYFAGDNFPAPGPGTSAANPGPDGGGTATFASTYNGSNPNGTWTLYVVDFGNSGDAGSIARGWTLQLQTSFADGVAPQTSIDSGPSGPTASASATFTFSANEFATFDCSLDSAAFSACASPLDVDGLADGAHTLSVRATDPTANVDATPATRTFTVDTVAPQTSIDSGPSGTNGGSVADFSFSASEAVAFECKVDDASFAACTSPAHYPQLGEGPHTFQLRATDAAGNVDRTGASRVFTFANKPGLTVAKPRLRRGKRNVKVSFSAIDDSTSVEALTFTCALDALAAQPCSSPTKFRRLAFGRHVVTVIATDLLGNQSEPATTHFKVKRKRR
jgi:subtilisin-like proprotein convertase family protein